MSRRAFEPELPVVNGNGAFHGRDKAAEPGDPYMPTAVAVDTPGHDGMALMARVFVEEYALMGWNRKMIRRMFENPRFVGPNEVLRERGEAFIDELIASVLGPERKEG